MARQKRLEARALMEDDLANDPDGLRIYLSNWTAEEKKIKAQEKEEDENQHQSDKIPELRQLHRVSATYRELVEEKNYLWNRPRGRYLKRKYKKLFKQSKTAVQETKAKLEEARAINEKLKQQKNAPKGVLIMGEGDVKRAERAFQAAKADYEYVQSTDAVYIQCSL